MTLLELFEDRPQSQYESSEEWYKIFGEYVPKSIYPTVYYPRYATDKGEHNYIKYYSEWFAKYQDEEINLLEVGVERGFSIYLWKSYFTKGKVYGMDINDGGNFKCDSTDKKAVDEQLGDLKFDIIIDDGDHNPESQIKTYKNLKNRLNDGGLYIIEDIHGPKYNNYIYEKGVNKIKSLGFEIIDTDGIHTISYLGIIRT
jgi:hypothetical protein